jgi:hypothetical protein
VELRLWTVPLHVFTALKGHPEIHTPPSTRTLVNFGVNRKKNGAAVALELLVSHLRLDELEIVAEPFRTG